MKDTTESASPLQSRSPQFIVYIDGYNLYKAIDHPTTLKLGWCNYRNLAIELVRESFLGPQMQIEPDFVTVRYFSARVNQTDNAGDHYTGGHKGEQARQEIWLEALEQETGIEPILGMHRPSRNSHREKMTDVNIALTMTEDARTLPVLGMVLVSGDMDFLPAIARVLEIGIPVAVFNPQDHANYALPLELPFNSKTRPAHTLFSIRHLGKDMLSRCSLGREADWIRYLEIKAESYIDRNPDVARQYATLLEETKQAERNR